MLSLNICSITTCNEAEVAEYAPVFLERANKLVEVLLRQVNMP